MPIFFYSNRLDLSLIHLSHTNHKRKKSKRQKKGTTQFPVFAADAELYMQLTPIPKNKATGNVANYIDD